MNNNRGVAGAMISVLVAAVVILSLMWLNSELSAHDNITCKQQSGLRYELCVAGQNPVYVPYATWRSARVGGYYDGGTRKVFNSADDDPDAPHGFSGGSNEDGHAVVHGDSDG